MLMQTQDSHSHLYNSLYPVADANRRLEELGGEDVVGELLAVIRGAGLQDVLGIRLLHKHNDIDAAEWMVERAVVDAEGYALITAVEGRQSGNALARNSWRYIDGAFVPVEFSDPALVTAPDFDLDEHAAVFDRIADVLKANAAELVLGPCLNYSKSVASNSPAPDAAFLEKTDFENRANVVRYVSRDEVAFAASAKTKWYAQQMIGPDGKPMWITACNCFCSVFPEGGHQGTKTHRYNP